MAEKSKKIITPKQMESRAKFATERAYQLERFSKYRDWKEIREWKSKAIWAYKQLADYYSGKIGGKKKMEYYRQKAEEIAPTQGGHLEKLVGKASPVLSIAFLAAALLLIVFNLTGYAVAGTSGSIKFLGIAFFLLGLVFASLYLKTRKD